MLTFIATPAFSQQGINLPIQNILQETPVWCWVAVSQQIILARVGPQQTPAQCALVAIANGAHPQACCGGYNPNCVKPGSIPQIQGLIQNFGMTYTSYAPPTTPDVLYHTLASGKAVILQIHSGYTPQGAPHSAHVVVLRGMTFKQTPNGIEPILIINDPMAYYSQYVPYSTIRPIWISAIVVKLF